MTVIYEHTDLDGDQIEIHAPEGGDPALVLTYRRWAPCGAYLPTDHDGLTRLINVLIALRDQRTCETCGAELQGRDGSS